MTKSSATSKVNRYEDVLWFNKERFESFVWWMTVLAVLPALPAGPRANASLLVERLLLVYAHRPKNCSMPRKSQGTRSRSC